MKRFKHFFLKEYNTKVNTDTKRILTLSLPIMGGMISQNILNLVDTLMIGQIGSLALAGSGIGAFIFFVLFIGFTGISSGVQTMVARFKGTNHPEHYPIALMLGLWVSIGLAICITIFTLAFSHELTAHFSTSCDVTQIGKDYLSFRVIGLTFFAICLVIRGFWNGASDPMRYLKVIIGIHVMNIILNYAFIFGHFGAPELGAAGAGLASSLALAMGAIIYLIDIRSFLRWRIGPIQSNGRWLAELSIPMALQQIIFAAGVTGFYWILGQISTNAMAIGNVLVNIILVAILPGVGLGMATMTLVSESLGKCDGAQTFTWPNKVLLVSIVMIGTISALAFAFPELILRPFMTDLDLLKQSILPLRLDCVGVMFEVGAIIFMNALNGADQTKLVAWVSSLLHWGFYLPLAYYFGVTLGHGILAAWSIYIIFQFIQLALFMLYWRLRFHHFIQPQLLTK